MREYIKEVCLIAIGSLLIAILFMQFIAVSNTVEINQDLKNEIEYLESRIEFYQNNEEWFEDFIEVLEHTWQQEVEIAVLKERIVWLDKYKESSEYKGTLYTQEQVNRIVDMLLKEIVEIKYTNDPLDVSYDEATQTFTITEYNQHGEVFDIDIVTVDEIIEGILNQN